MKKKTIAQRIDRALALETGLRLSSNDVLALDLEWHGRKNYDSYVTLSYPPVGQSGQAFQTRYDGLLNDHERQRLSANLDNMLEKTILYIESNNSISNLLWVRDSVWFARV